MKTILKKPWKVFILGLLSLVACSSDDDDTIVPIKENLTINVEVFEYPSETSLIATIESGLTGSLTFALARISVEGALALDSDSGILTVLDPTAFDFENASSITGNITVTNGSETEEWSLNVTLKDIDDIAYWLTASKVAYQEANSGNWMLITEDEYIELAARISGISKTGTTDILYEQGFNADDYQTYSDSTVSNDLSTIPENSYVFAFKYLALADELDGNKVKVSTGPVTEGYADLGNTLPTHNQGQQYFVLKGAPQSTTNGRGFLGIYSQNGVSYDTLGKALGTHYFGEGDTNTLDAANLVQGVCIYQGLSTPIKQWN